MDVHAWLKTASGCELTEAQLRLFASYHDVLTEENKTMNLTAIEGETDVYVRHFYDSLAIASAVTLKGKSLLDVGTGAGFPGVPLKIAEDSLRLTLVESRKKRVGFLNRLVDELGLDDVSIIRSRAEQLTCRESFDIVTARAVASLDVLAEITMPWVKTGGSFIAMKSAGSEEEVRDAEHAIDVLGGTIEQTVPYDVEGVFDHVLVIIRKTHVTPPEYPRRYGKIKKEPL